MPRPKKDGKYLNLRIRSDIYDRFESFCENTGRIKTTALEMILTQYLDEYDKAHKYNQRDTLDCDTNQRKPSDS